MVPMTCVRCGQDAPADAAFCPRCWARLGIVCPQCATLNAPYHSFCKRCGQRLAERRSDAALAAQPAAPRFGSPEAYTPRHLAEKVLGSKAALEGKLVTVLFADLKGSMELLADRDPEEARKILDPVLERMMEAVHRYEGTVNQVMGDGVMALFGAPVAHEDHAVRACYAALRMQEAVRHRAALPAPRSTYEKKYFAPRTASMSSDPCGGGSGSCTPVVACTSARNVAKTGSR